MGASIRKAIELILSADPELLNILSTTAKVCLTSSILALLIGVPVGILLGAERFPGRKVLLVLNRTLIGMPPVVCGLLFYMLFSGVGPFRHLHWLFTVKLMILAQVVLITPIIIGVMETFVADTAPALRGGADEGPGHRSSRRAEREKALRRRDGPHGPLPHPDEAL